MVLDIRVLHAKLMLCKIALSVDDSEYSDYTSVAVEPSLLGTDRGDVTVDWMFGGIVRCTLIWRGWSLLA